MCIFPRWSIIVKTAEIAVNKLDISTDKKNTHIVVKRYIFCVSVCIYIILDMLTKTCNPLMLTKSQI